MTMTLALSLAAAGCPTTDDSGSSQAADDDGGTQAVDRDAGAQSGVDGGGAHAGGGAHDAGADADAGPAVGRTYPSFDVILEGSFPVNGIYAVAPLVVDEHVYWSPGDRTIRRIALEPGSSVETIYTGTEGDVSVRAVGGGYAYFGTFSLDTLPLGRVKVDGSAAQPKWIADTLSASGGLRDSAWLVAGGRLWAGPVVDLASGTVLDQPSIDTYIDGEYCMMGTEADLGLCFTTKVDFAKNSYAETYAVSMQGASGLGVFAASPHGWYLIDGDASFEGEYRVVQIPYGAGEPTVIFTGDGGTAHKTGRANADTLVMTGDACHQLQLVSLEPPYAVQSGELYLSFDGPCVRVLHVDATYAYLNSAHGLLRIALDELRGALVQK